MFWTQIALYINVLLLILFATLFFTVANEFIVPSIIFGFAPLGHLLMVILLGHLLIVWPSQRIRPRRPVAIEDTKETIQSQNNITDKEN